MVPLSKVSKFMDARHPWHPFYLGPWYITFLFHVKKCTSATPKALRDAKSADIEILEWEFGGLSLEAWKQLSDGAVFHTENSAIYQHKFI